MQLEAKKKLKTIFLKSLSNLLIVLLLIFIASSCIKAPSNSRSSSSSNNSTANSPKNSTKLPDFTQGNNFIQNGGLVYTSSVAFDLSFSDTLQLRGKDVDAYIRNTGTQNISCLTGRFNDNTLKQINIIAAMPRSIYNFSTQTLEYYYSLSPADETANKNFCQKSGLINKLNSLYSQTNPNLTFKISDLCPSNSCISSVFTSQPLELFSQNGSPLIQIATKQLTYTITNRPNISSPIGQSCITNSECLAQGYNCCSLGQCVKDLALKPGVDQKNDINYQQALQDILNTPSHIYLYPQYYFLCSNTVNQPTSPSTPSNPSNDAKIRLNDLTDLYNCTNKIEGEMGYCTKTISGAQISENGNIFEYTTGSDDRNFSTTYTNQSVTSTAKEDLISIQSISFGEVTLFDYDQLPKASESVLRGDNVQYSQYLKFVSGLHNDDNSSPAKIQITKKPSTAVSDNLIIKYKVDASCTQINKDLAKCEKYYVQGQQESSPSDLAKNRRGRVTDHYISSSFFMLPSYASTSKTITVQVDGVTLKQDIDWKVNATNPANIEFFPTSTGGMRVFDTQKVKITYFVDNLSVNHVMDSKIEALTKIKTMCHCADLNCALAPVKNNTGTIIDYACIYPDPSPVVPPISQKIYLSSKTVPVRYFDSAGISVATITGNTPPQEGTAFSYRRGNLLNPNNMPDITNPISGNYYVGFNEIYGSLSYTNNSAKPAKEVPVTKGKTYDIYVDSGTYSNCIQCGNDYYSQLNKLFPLTQFGGGVVPLQSRTNRSLANGIASDDLAFGRACLVPATMIPWTHTISSDPKEQRESRMRAQHFLFANGYQHDWYGFDYGSVIGSFDGVKWFSIGSNRRIKADSNKLFIAVNGIMGDLALESTYTVTINDGSLNPVGSNMISSDLQSDGAQCQKFHQCNTDNDCATSLGWDYICTNVNETTTSWPKFDDNAKEIPDSQRDDNRLIGILGISTSGNRCVYRGRGAACTQNYLQSALDTAINSNSTFNLTANQSMHTCSSNNYCQNIANSNSLNAKFNNKIVRYGQVRIDSNSDSFGLGAKVPGRPMEFNAEEPIEEASRRNFNNNKIAGICIPGRTPEADTFVSQNSTTPPSEYTGDKILGIGMSWNKNTAPSIDTINNPPIPNAYLASCSVMDNNHNYYYAKSTPNTLLTDTNLPEIIELRRNSATQSISTNALYIFKSIFEQPARGLTFSMYSSNVTPITSQTFTENRCMRAPGASCFTDTDCAPSKAIADKIKMLNPDDVSITSILNKYEVKFWQEELVCSQATSKSDPAYSPSNNRCCREVGKTISLPSSDISNNVDMSSVPGVDISMSDKNRYSRVSTVYKDQRDDWLNSPRNFPPLKAPVKDQCGAGNTNCMNIGLVANQLTNQFRTFSSYAERTSCSGDWVRNFSTGDHTWDKARFQNFNLTMFRCMNWLPGNNTVANWSCAGLEKDSPSCQLIQTSPYSGKAKAIMSYLGKLELMGIPQITYESGEYFNQTTEGDLSCRSFPTDQNGCYPGHPDSVNCSPTANPTKYSYPTGLYKSASTPIAELVDPNSTPANLHLYSGVDKDNFQNMKEIFKADEIASCYPAGTNMAVGANPSLCCTGFINSKNNKCQIQDFVDISIYTNRYVSSEAKKLSLNLFDQSGYIKDPSYVAQIACEKSMCASGSIAFGVLISKLKTPGQETIDSKSFRFLEGNIKADDLNGVLSMFNSGLKLNSHAYCYPTGATAGEDLTVINCGN